MKPTGFPEEKKADMPYCITTQHDRIWFHYTRKSLTKKDIVTRLTSFKKQVKLYICTYTHYTFTVQKIVQIVQQFI